jgi:peroxiredoxin
MRARRRAGHGLLVGLSLALLGGCAGETLYRPLRVGDPAPAYAAATLDGDTLALEELRGTVVLLNVWATWCPPCREEMPGLEALHREFSGQPFRVLGVSVDGATADREVREFVERNGITFGILRDPEERVVRAFRTVGVPETFLIDREGRIAWRWIGPFDPTAAEVKAKVRAALGS